MSDCIRLSSANYYSYVSERVVTYSKILSEIFFYNLSLEEVDISLSLKIL